MNGDLNERISLNTLEEFEGSYDVIFLTTKSYVLRENIEEIKKITHKDTIIIPLQVLSFLFFKKNKKKIKKKIKKNRKIIKTRMEYLLLNYVKNTLGIK